MINFDLKPDAIFFLHFVKERQEIKPCVSTF